MKLTNPVAGANHSAQAYYTLPANYFKAGTTYVCTFYVKSMEGDDLFQIQLQTVQATLEVITSARNYQPDNGLLLKQNLQLTRKTWIWTILLSISVAVQVSII